jgi:hypothetical protein
VKQILFFGTRVGNLDHRSSTYTANSKLLYIIKWNVKEGWNLWSYPVWGYIRLGYSIYFRLGSPTRFYRRGLYGHIPICICITSNPVQKTEINGRGSPLRWPRDTLYPQKLALTSPTSGGRSVGIVRLRTKSHGVVVLLLTLNGFVCNLRACNKYCSCINIFKLLSISTCRSPVYNIYKTKRIF